MVVLDTLRTETKALNATKFGKRMALALKELSILLCLAQAYETTGQYASSST